MKAFTKLFAFAVAVLMAFAATGCATTASFPSPPTEKLTAAELASLETQPVSYKEISGFWMGLDTGQLSDFSLKDVRISGKAFSGHFFLKSTGNINCSIDNGVKGVYLDGVFEFQLRDVACAKNWFYQARLDVDARKGSYFTGPKARQGLYVIQTVER